MHFKPQEVITGHPHTSFKYGQIWLTLSRGDQRMFYAVLQMFFDAVVLTLSQ